MEVRTQIRIDSNSRIPKYQQIVHSIIEDIEKGLLEVGQKIPSINEISEEYYLSRDTVEKAYNQLKEKKIIVSAKGKGFYVARAMFSSQVNVLFLLNKLSSYKLRIYNAFVNSMGTNAKIDLSVYHCDPKILLNILQENTGAYDYYVIMPHFKDKDLLHQNSDQTIMQALQAIPANKLLVMDNYLPELDEKVAAVYQDFRADIYEALKEGLERLRKYHKLILAYPRKALYPYPLEILQGFQKFCLDSDFDFEVLDTIYPDMELQAKDAYITIEEMDLVNLVKQVRDQGFALGKEIGVISYNDTPLKELLGITVIFTDFQAMGETAAYMILKNKKEAVKNVFHFINRNSI
jgi:DNA-binding transcriptional regulator YhcF (GntR family)